MDIELALLEALRERRHPALLARCSDLALLYVLRTGLDVARGPVYKRDGDEGNDTRAL